MEENNKQIGFLIDSTKCIGCRGCQVACKQWNDLPAEKTEFFGGPGYQNPADLSASTYTLIKFHEVIENGKLAEWTFWKKQCQHCLEPACSSACLVGALEKTKEGPVVWNENKCIGCRYCMIACPYSIPKFEWSKVIADIHKCTLCINRIAEGLEPACAKTCPTDAILYGYRDELLAIAKKRLQENPDKYHQHIYGEEEVGGTCVLNISSIPLEEFGYPKNLSKEALGTKTATAMHAIPSVVIGLGAVLGATAIIANRKNQVAVSLEKESSEKGGKNE